MRGGIQMELYSTYNSNIYTNYIHLFSTNEIDNTVKNLTTGEMFEVLSSETCEYFTILIVE